LLRKRFLNAQRKPMGRSTGRRVTDTSVIETATRRLQSALDALEGAVERQLEQDKGHAALATQVHAFDSDRARLAGELDAVTAHARQLEATNREVAQRLDEAIATIRSIIDAQDG
jgi:DNA-binding FrmR family transcriptional regulator